MGQEGLGNPEPALQMSVGAFPETEGMGPRAEEAWLLGAP